MQAELRAQLAQARSPVHYASHGLRCTRADSPTRALRRVAQESEECAQLRQRLRLMAEVAAAERESALLSASESNPGASGAASPPTHWMLAGGSARVAASPATPSLVVKANAASVVSASGSPAREGSPAPRGGAPSEVVDRALAAAAAVAAAADAPAGGSNDAARAAAGAEYDSAVRVWLGWARGAATAAAATVRVVATRPAAAAVAALSPAPAAVQPAAATPEPAAPEPEPAPAEPPVADAASSPPNAGGDGDSGGGAAGERGAHGVTATEALALGSEGRLRGAAVSDMALHASWARWQGGGDDDEAPAAATGGTATPSAGAAAAAELAAAAAARASKRRAKARNVEL